MNKREIINKKIEDIIPYENNPRKNDEAVEYVANSIKEFGFNVPIIIDKENVIVAGHTRYKAAQELGLKEVPCIVVDDLTEDQIKAFRIADNKTGEKAGWDLEKLKLEIEDLDFDLKDFGFGEFELSILTDDMEPEPYDDDLINKYSENADEFLVNKRIMITYKTDEEEQFIRNLINEHREEMKVVYTCKEVMEQINEE